MVISGCSSTVVDFPLIEKRPLGKDMMTFSTAGDNGEPGAVGREFKAPEGVITLREALSSALMGNPELAAFSWEIRAAEARALQAGLIPNPEIEIEAEEFGGIGERRNFKGAAGTLVLSQLIELGSKGSKRRRVASLESGLAGWDYEAKRLEVVSETTKTFIEVIAAQDLVTLKEELLRLAEEVLTTVSERVKAGKVSPIEETRAKISVSTSRIGVVQAKRDLKIARKKLAAAWGGKTALFEQARGDLDTINPVPPVGNLWSLLLQNPDIARWELEIKQRKAALDLEKANRIPDLTLNAGMQRFNETHDGSFLFGVSIPIPLFDRNQGGIREALHSLSKANEERRATEVQIHAALTEAYQTLACAHSEAKTLKDDVLPSAEQVFKDIKEGYRLGKFGYLEVLEAQQTLFEVKEQYIESLATYHSSVADVEHLIARGLESLTETPKNETKGNDNDK